jgi:type III pantothenate kinase
MTPTVVVDVGNTRIKWGRCVQGQIKETISLPPDSESWQAQVVAWRLQKRGTWVLSGVHPPRRDRLADWLRARGEQVQIIDSWRELDLKTNVESPEKVGIDRLLNALAAVGIQPGRLPAIVISAGSAVTVDWIDESGTFCGGAIFPGPGLMARALHDYTALLPIVEINDTNPVVPAKSTIAAIEAGIFCASVGGISEVCTRLQKGAGNARELYLTGGYGKQLGAVMAQPFRLWPEMTLEGLRLAAKRLP